MTMDKVVLKQKLLEKCEAKLDRALAAVEGAPEGQIIAASEWVVREAFQDLTRECFQELVQARANVTPSAGQTAFSPSGGGSPARQRKA